MSFCGLGERGSYYVPSTTGNDLGPGSYTTKTMGELHQIKKRSPSDKPLAFGSGAARNINQLDSRKFSPGPGFYQHKQKTTFNKEYMKSESDQDFYFLI